ncbi:NmrA family NAD(P)-binding protein [Pseudonocardia xinjiangensis]|uniref:NmrA family NAD(P)-binding protein n=1 Tax=Pseudonocardia xinjiangensis TaxID=75289 RepID=UPI003D944B39
MTILVTGATGKAGRHVVEHLLRTGQDVRALTRRPERAALPAGVQVVAGDLTDPDTLGPAFDGVTAVHLLTTGGDDYATLTTGPEIADLAEKAGVRRVALLWNGQDGPVEQAVEASGLEWTRLQPVDFMSNALAWAASIATDGVVREPFADVPVAVVHEADVGAVAAAVLVGEGHAGRTYSITGPETLTPRQRVAVIAGAIGRPVEFVELTEEQARARWRADGYADELIDLLVAWQSNPPAAASTVADTVERLTGRPPLRFDRWAAEQATAFR